MPTIDQLDNVVVASDTDMLPASQNGIARRVSRSQLLAGTQTAISLTPGLLGRASPGLGPPQQIVLGGGLSMTGNVLSGAPRYSAASLATSPSANLTDLVPIGRDGQDVAVPVRALLSVGGADVSNQLVRTSYGPSRRLGDWLGDAVTVEAFGAVGDGVTDDTGAINLAIASGRPVLLGPKTYRIDGQWSLQSSAVLIGSPGLTVLRRRSQIGGAWISISAPSFVSVGIIYDAGAVSGDSWAVLITSTCTRTYVDNCAFINSIGSTLGSGLTIQARDGLAGEGSSHHILNCRFENNACHGIWIQAASGAVVAQCQASNNGGFGICLDFNDPQFQQVVRRSIVTDSKCWNNLRGISIGNYNETNLEPPRWGLKNPDALDIIVSGNICSGNTSYGIAVSGARIQVIQNQIVIDDGSAQASGILCNASVSTVSGNSIVGPGTFGIDAGGSADSSIVSNIISDCHMGINAGGSARMRIAENRLLDNSRAVTLFQVETDGRGANFGQASCDTWIEDNLIQINGGGGIFLLDGPERVEISRNRFVTSLTDDGSAVCWAHTDSVFIDQNTINGSPVGAASANTTGGVVTVVVPDVLDRATIDVSTTRVDAVLGIHQLAMANQISFVKVIAGGQGYTTAKIVIAGSGFGATATPYLRDGVIIGISLTSGGSGYDPATTSANIIGDGTGAQLRAFVGVPARQEWRLSLHCPSSTHFTQGNVGGVQSNWTKTDFTVAAGTDVVLLAVDRGWQAVTFESIDYVQPGGDGSVSIRSVQGDIRLNTAIGGGVRFRSDSEQNGFLTYFGRGSPEGQVIAPPGSDYRNLDGGIGTTLWIKRVGSSSSGWFSIA